jgi:hypothetical protein
MHKLTSEQHAAHIAAIDRPQTQENPLLTVKTFNSAAHHEIMLYGYGNLGGADVTFSVVRGFDSWALYYSSFSRSADYVAEHGQRASVIQVQQLISCEDGLIELYRN